MRTKEEIDELYHKLYDISLDGEDTLHYYSFIEGYTQCQKYMAKELEMHILLNEHDWSRNPQAQLRDFINLNKQD